MAAFGPAAFDMILTGKLQRGFSGFRPAGDEENARQAMRCIGNQHIGQPLLRFVRKVAGMRVAKAVDLPFYGLANSRMPVAQTANRGSSRCVEIPLTARVVKKQAFAANSYGKGSSSISAKYVTHVLGGLGYPSTPTTWLGLNVIVQSTSYDCT